MIYNLKAHYMGNTVSECVCVCYMLSSTVAVTETSVNSHELLFLVFVV